MNLVKTINYPSVSTIKNFGFLIGKDFIKIKAHVIKSPMLQYYGARIQITKPGEWRVNDEKFLIPGKAPTKWGILIMSKNVKQYHVEKFGKGIVQMANKHGLEFIDFDPYCVFSFNKKGQDELEKKFKELKHDKKMELLFVIIRNNNDKTNPEEDQYSAVKKAESKFNLLTQCIKEKTIASLSLSTLYNILIKDNSKLGGTNHKIVPDETVSVSINKRPFMVIGADVTHSSSGQKEIPSVVGVVASYDRNGFRYNCTMRLQKNRKTNRAVQEIIENFDEMVLEHLHFFKTKHNRLPEHILYYRDGVSEGQFAHVIEIEVSAIKKACAILGKPNIEVTVMIVQKRHHTRFFPDPKKNTMDRYNNVTPGTVVDSVIVDPENWQFFMVPHISMKGVAKPTKYSVVYNDVKNLTNAELQVFTFHLCHLFTRCNRAVSYVAPTYYAHLVAARGRALIHGEDIDMKNLEKENEKMKINPDFANDHPMFFV
ncbi:protein argonaute-2-like [Culicoides brevitarsis]|uniref:protein argonaute-2-like n=1 Tax=Culicoides brevitarsis TaxID=469753 RepID=UPI00307B2151